MPYPSVSFLAAIWGSSDCPPSVPGSPRWRPTLQPCPQTQSLMRSTRPRRLTLKAQGNTHTQREREGAQIQAQSARHVQCTYEHANRQINTKSRWMRPFTGTLTHRLAPYQKHSKPWQHKHRPAGTPWHSNSLPHQTCNCTLRNKPCTKSISSLLRSYLIFIYPYVTAGLTSLLHWPRRHYSGTGMNENNIASSYMSWRNKQRQAVFSQSVFQSGHYYKFINVG